MVKVSMLVPSLWDCSRLMVKRKRRLFLLRKYLMRSCKRSINCKKADILTNKFLVGQWKICIRS